MNRLNENELYELHFRVCVAAVHEAFRICLSPGLSTCQRAI